MQFDEQMLRESKKLYEGKVLKEFKTIFDNIEKVYKLTGQNLHLRIPLNQKQYQILGSNFPAWMYLESRNIDGSFKGYDYKPFWVHPHQNTPSNPFNEPDPELIALLIKYKEQINEELNHTMSHFLETNFKSLKKKSRKKK